MNIDILFTPAGETGLIASENLFKKAAGVVLDTATGTLTLEYADSDYMDLNIPIESDFFETLEHCTHIHIGAVKAGHIAQAYQVPFMFLDDPYRGQKRTTTSENPLMAFNYFVKQCRFGQPVHRDNLGDEDSMGCILGDATPASLQFAPHLAKRHALEAGIRAAPTYAPRMAGPGLGGGSSGGGYISSGTKPTNPDPRGKPKDER
jgi:hypothetical protein